MDIDIDLADREQLLKLVKHIPASMTKQDELVKHNTVFTFNSYLGIGIRILHL